MRAPDHARPKDARATIPTELLRLLQPHLFPVTIVISLYGNILRVAELFAYTTHQGPIRDRLVNLARRHAIGVKLMSLFLTAVFHGLLIPCVVAEDSESEPREYHWNFGREDDQGFDRLPDDWMRGEGIGFPKYVKIVIAPHDESLAAQLQAIDSALVLAWPSVRQALSTWFTLPALPPSLLDPLLDKFLLIELDGGQAMIQSPPKPTDQLFQYRFSCRVMTEGLKYDTAIASLVFLDSKGKEISALSMPPVTGTTPWRRLEIDRVRPPESATSMLVRLSVKSGEDGLQDIRGRIGFDEIRIEPFPQLQLETDHKRGIYNKGQPITVTARVLGINVTSSDVQFRVLDHNGDVVHQKRTSIQTLKSNVGVDDTDATVQWQLPDLEPGFYRVTGMFADDHSTRLATDVTLAVIESLGRSEPSGPFGWSLPPGTETSDIRDFSDWLVQLGVAWLKVPVWMAPEDTSALVHHSALVNKLQNSGIQTIGVLDVPPVSEYSTYEITSQRDAIAANLFRDSNVWQPRLEPLMSQLTLKVRMWQLGNDFDSSFLGRPRLDQLIASIRTGLQGFGQSIDVAIAWPWLEPTFADGDSTWQAMHRSSDPPLTSAELDAVLVERKLHATVAEPRTWLALDPIRKSQYDRDLRIRDLVLRMTTVLHHDVQVATVTNPFDPEQGLLLDDGRPNEMLLPWRTVSWLLGSLKYVGKLDMRSGADNQVFAGQDRAVVMMWSPTPIVEELFLGDNVQSVDVWGHVRDVPTVEHAGHPAQRIEIGPMPIFVIGADPTLLAFRMSVALGQTQLDSVLGQSQQLSVVYTNPTREAMAGGLRLNHPDTWQVDSASRSWELLGGRSSTQTFDVVLGNSAMIGEYELAMNFDFQSTPAREITVYRKINVGAEGLDIKLTPAITAGDELQVIMEITNHSSKKLAYDCVLFPPPGRQYQRRFVEIDANQTIVREFYWNGGRELIGGRVLLRAVEQDGKRVLNIDAVVTSLPAHEALGDSERN